MNIKFHTNLNFIWIRDPSEAYKNPYEYLAQEQFSRESFSILVGFKKNLETYNRNFQIDERSLEKAIWMLHIDAVDTLLECHDLISKKKHKVTGRLFRDTIEALDLAALFDTRTSSSNKLLNDWYEDKIIPNSRYRDYVKKNIGMEKAEQLTKFYSMLSKLNHRSYRTLAYGFIRGKDDKLVYDGFSDSNSLIFPGVISMYYCLLANLILITSDEIVKRNLIDAAIIKKIWDENIEPEPENRKYEITFKL